MGDLNDGMKNVLRSFPFNFITQLFTSAYKPCEIKLHESLYIILLPEPQQYN